MIISQEVPKNTLLYSKQNPKNNDEHQPRLSNFFKNFDSNSGDDLCYQDGLDQRLIGKRSVIRLDHQELKKVICYVLHNNPEIDTYLAKFESLKDLDFATFNIDGQSTDVEAPPDIIDVDEDDDFIDDDDDVPRDLKDSDDEVLANDFDDDVAILAAVARGHGGDNYGHDPSRPPPRPIRIGFRARCPGPSKCLNRAKSKVFCRQGSRTLAFLRDHQMESFETREYPSLIQTFFDTHTDGNAFAQDEARVQYEEMIRLRDLGANMPTDVPYTEDQIMAMEANSIQSEAYLNQDSHYSYFHQSHYDRNDSETSLRELNNDVRNDLEDFKRCVRSMRTVHWKLFAKKDGEMYMINSTSNNEYTFHTSSNASSRVEKTNDLHNENNYCNQEQGRSCIKPRKLKFDINHPNTHFCKPIKQILKGELKFWSTCDPNIRECNGGPGIYGMDEERVIKRWHCYHADDRKRINRGGLSFPEFLLVKYGETQVKELIWDDRFEEWCYNNPNTPTSRSTTIQENLNPRLKDYPFKDWLLTKAGHTNISEPVQKTLLKTWKSEEEERRELGINTKELMDTLPLGRENSARFRDVIQKEVDSGRRSHRKT
nr:hypothetical protein [Tanacetum cinerariifolium]